MNICNKTKPSICKYLFSYLEQAAWYLSRGNGKVSGNSGFLNVLLFASGGRILQYCLSFLGETFALWAEENSLNKGSN